MHFPCFRKRAITSRHNGKLQFAVWFQRTEVSSGTHALVTEAHGAGFAFAQKEKTAIVQDEGSTGAIFCSAAHFTGVVRLCKEIRH